MEKYFYRYRTLSGGVLFMRLFLGGMLLLHNVSKLQNYNELINYYPSIWILSPQAVFVVSSITEVLFAVMVMVGFKTRVAATILLLEMLSIIMWLGVERSKIEFIWSGICLFLVISGGGFFSFDSPNYTQKKEK